MSDLINLRGLRALGKHGLAPGEKDSAQPFEVDLDLYLDLSAAARSDDIEDTIDYGPLSVRIVDLIEGESFDLIEILAERIAEVAKSDARVEKVTVSLRKLRPPVAAHLDSAGVTITR
ncbi:MAG: dihydroneopterin aldolase [Actinobacteria bacterium]|nr:dihydroneopterin aldolase [Actinomycetota bacterium]